MISVFHAFSSHFGTLKFICVYSYFFVLPALYRGFSLQNFVTVLFSSASWSCAVVLGHTTQHVQFTLNLFFLWLRELGEDVFFKRFLNEVLERGALWLFPGRPISFSLILLLLQLLAAFSWWAFSLGHPL